MTPVEKLKTFRTWMSERIKGQPEVVEALDRHIGRSELGLTSPEIPLGAWLFVGPTGVGKTESAKCISKFVFDNERALSRLDMSEFNISDSVNEVRRRLGRAHAAGGRVYLFDEIEKAHPDVLDLLLQILDAARITLADATALSFTNCYVIATSNLGAREAMRSRTLNYTLFSNTVHEYVRRRLRPELLGRVDRAGRVLVFRKLEEPQQREIAAHHIKHTLARMHALGHELRLDDSAFEHILRRGFHPELGARPLLGVIADAIEGAVAEQLRNGAASARGTLSSDPTGARLILHASAA